jgi:hypothetical protein
MAVTLKDYLDRPLESYCSEILDEWRNLSRIDVPVLTCRCWGFTREPVHAMESGGGWQTSKEVPVAI